jgi:hypothetical protein
MYASAISAINNFNLIYYLLKNINANDYLLFQY